MDYKKLQEEIAELEVKYNSVNDALRKARTELVAGRLEILQKEKMLKKFRWRLDYYSVKNSSITASKLEDGGMVFINDYPDICQLFELSPDTASYGHFYFDIDGDRVQLQFSDGEINLRCSTSSMKKFIADNELLVDLSILKERKNQLRAEMGEIKAFERQFNAT